MHKWFGVTPNIYLLMLQKMVGRYKICARLLIENGRTVSIHTRTPACKNDGFHAPLLNCVPHTCPMRRFGYGYVWHLLVQALGVAPHYQNV